MNVLSLLSLILCITLACNRAGGEPVVSEREAYDLNVKASSSDRLASIRLKAADALQFCKARKLNTDFYIHIDLGLHSGLKRLFIWDFTRDSITHGFLVSHGCCSSAWGTDGTRENAGVSNTDGSHCSSIGRYKIGQRGYSNWGIHVKYFLHGLDSTNSNALKRDIVFHSWESVSDEEVYPRGTPEGWGCPAVSNKAMRLIDEKLKTAKENVLLWVTKEGEGE